MIFQVGSSNNGAGVESDDVDYISSAWHPLKTRRYVSSLLPHICWAIMTMNEASVALRTRGSVNSVLTR